MTEIVLVLLAVSCLTNTIGQLMANKRIKELETLWDILVKTLKEFQSKEETP